MYGHVPVQISIFYLTLIERIHFIISANSGEGNVINSRFCTFVVCWFVFKITQKVVDGL